MERRTKHALSCVDGKRRRRHSEKLAKRLWYAKHRNARFAKHLGFTPVETPKAA